LYNVYKKIGVTVKFYNYFIFSIVIAVFHTHSLDAMRALVRGVRNLSVVSRAASVAPAAARARVYAARPARPAVLVGCARVTAHRASVHDYPDGNYSNHRDHGPDDRGSSRDANYPDDRQYPGDTNYPGQRGSFEEKGHSRNVDNPDYSGDSGYKNYPDDRGSFHDREEGEKIGVGTGFTLLFFGLSASDDTPDDPKKLLEKEVEKIQIKIKKRSSEYNELLGTTIIIHDFEFIGLISRLKCRCWFPLLSGLQDIELLLEQTMDIKKDFETLERTFNIPHEIIVRESSYETILKEIKQLERAIKLIEESPEYKKEVCLCRTLVDLVETPLTLP